MIIEVSVVLEATCDGFQRLEAPLVDEPITASDLSPGFDGAMVVELFVVELSVSGVTVGMGRSVLRSTEGAMLCP